MIKLKDLLNESVNEAAKIKMNALDWGKSTAERNANLDKYDSLKTDKEREAFLRKLKGESVNEVASRTAMEIGGYTGLNKNAVQKFVDDNNLDIEKVFQYVKKGKLPERMDLVSAIAGRPNNPIQKKMIKMFAESVNEGQINEWKLQLDLGKVNPSEFENWANDSLQKKHKIKVSGSGKNWTIVGKGNDDRMGSSANWITQLLGKAWTTNKIKVVQKESVNEAQKINPTSMKFLKGMKKIKVKGLGGYMPGVDYVYVNGDKYYFVDSEGDHMELKNTNTIKQLHKLHGKSLGESVNEATDKDFEKVYSIFDKKDYFGLKGSIKTMLGNWQRALDKGDKGAERYSKEDIIKHVTDSVKDRAKQTYDELVTAIKNKDIKALKSKLRHDQKFSLAVFAQVTGKTLPKSTRDIQSFLDNEFMNESINEADYQVYHKSFTDAADAARKLAEKRGFEIDEDDWQTQVALGGKNLRSRPSVGKETRFTVGLLKGGKPQRKALSFQVYGMKNGYELNAYIN